MIVLVFFVIYQQVENHLLQPVIMSHTVQLNPLTVLVSVLLAAELGGLVGAPLAGGQEGLPPGSSRCARLLCRQRSRPNAWYDYG
ncbi:AI-2E family transporter [Micromonospora inositola]|uniref:Uncharacterized protein n=1 Tax=Micromonospora inositola TaxID=47865 RepID=A0A1C5J657_9ACTN|nr:AI-2E family transporter [Micromonospora inositola]SCG66058.1 protein of unknown function DUF20 [Micromonospora inositola]